MGYTHYFYINSNADSQKYAKAIEEVKKVVELGKNSLILNSEETGRHSVFFNGIGDDSHETFCLPKTPSDVLKRSFIQKDDDGFVFSFCKTARKPYDLYVTAALCILKHYMKEDLKVCSDGRDFEWEEGLSLASEIVGEKVDSPLSMDEE